MVTLACIERCLRIYFFRQSVIVMAQPKLLVLSFFSSALLVEIRLMHQIFFLSIDLIVGFTNQWALWGSLSAYRPGLAAVVLDNG